MKISRKLSIWTLVALVGFGGVASYAHYRQMLAGEAAGLQSMGSTVGPIIEEALAHSMITRDEKVLRTRLKNMAAIETIQGVFLVDTEGAVKAATDDSALGKQLLKLDGKAWGASAESQWETWAQGDRAYRWVQAVNNKPECHRCHSPEARYNGAIVIDFSVNVLKRTVQGHVVKGMLIFMVAFVGAGAVLFLLTNSVIIVRLTNATRLMSRFKEGDGSVRIPVSGDDELTRLSEGFNSMAEAMTVSRDELRNYADELLALAVASSVISGVPKTENLYEAVCTISVRELNLLMAWIGLVNEGSYAVEPVAHSGREEDYLSRISVRLDNSPEGSGPTAMAIKSKTPQVVADMTTDPRYTGWREEAAKRGYRSSMALPLVSSRGDVVGVLNLYSGAAGYFSRKRVRMFTILANQVSAAIENRTLIENVEDTSAELAKQLGIISISQKEWEMTFDSITDMVSIHDKEFRILRANKALADHLGMPREEIIGKHCYHLMHNTMMPITGCPHQKTMQDKRVATEEVRDPRTGRLFRISTYPYHSHDGEYLGSVHIARDITQEKETEKQLMMSERLASLGQLASGLAHEINNPLASIAGCAEGLLQKVRTNRYDPKLFEEYLQIVEEEIHRCKNITSGMLSFVRNTTYETREVRINQELDKTLDIISFQGRLRGVEIVREYADDLPLISASEGELRQVILAIVINALDAMDDQGRLLLRTGRDERWVWAAITDSGPGIAADNVNKIFDPFFTTKSEKGGTGLGLSIAYKIITNHGGTIEVNSILEKGTTLTLKLPIRN